MVKATEFISGWEGYKPNAYQDVGGVWTIGHGLTELDGMPVKEGDVLDDITADNLFVDRVTADQKYVEDYGKRYGYDWSPEQITALTSFTYNLGKGGLDQLTRNGTRDNTAIAEYLPKYNKAGGQRVQGLQNRRDAELALFRNSSNSGSRGTSGFASTWGSQARPMARPSGRPTNEPSKSSWVNDNVFTQTPKNVGHTGKRQGSNYIGSGKGVGGYGHLSEQEDRQRKSGQNHLRDHFDAVERGREVARQRAAGTTGKIKTTDSRGRNWYSFNKGGKVCPKNLFT